MTLCFLNNSCLVYSPSRCFLIGIQDVLSSLSNFFHYYSSKYLIISYSIIHITHLYNYTKIFLNTSSFFRIAHISYSSQSTSQISLLVQSNAFSCQQIIHPAKTSLSSRILIPLYSFHSNYKDYESTKYKRL